MDNQQKKKNWQKSLNELKKLNLRIFVFYGDDVSVDNNDGLLTSNWIRNPWANTADITNLHDKLVTYVPTAVETNDLFVFQGILTMDASTIIKGFLDPTGNAPTSIESLCSAVNPQIVEWLDTSFASNPIPVGMTPTLYSSMSLCVFYYYFSI